VQLPALPSLADLAGYIRHRLAAVDTLWRRGDAALEASGERAEDGADLVVVAAAAPFAATSFARARLLRQMHACGLLSEHESVRAERLLGVAGSR
jgi:hypothetical protein